MKTVKPFAAETERKLLEVCANIVERYAPRTEINPILINLQAQVDALMAVVSRGDIEEMPPVPDTPPPELHRMDTPTQPPSPPGIDPMSQAAGDPWIGQGRPMAAPTAPAGFGPSSSNGIGRPAAPPPYAMNRPQTWNNAVMETPAPSHPLESPIGSPLHGAYGPNQAPPPQLQIPNGAQYMGNQKKMDEPSSYLKGFSGNPVDFKHWSERFVDHMAKVHVMWRSTLNWMGRTNEDLSYDRLRTEAIGPFNENGVEIAQKLEATIIGYMPESMYNNRVELCGGPMEANNGFKLWRRFLEDTAGTGDSVESAGIEALWEFPRCDKHSGVVEHVDRWKTMIDTDGRGIPVPWLRVQILSIIPKDLKSEIMRDGDMVGAGHVRIIEWIRRRCSILRQETMAEVVKRNLTSQARKKVHALQNPSSCKRRFGHPSARRR